MDQAHVDNRTRMRGTGTVFLFLTLGLIGCFGSTLVPFQLGHHRGSRAAFFAGVVLLVTGPFAGRVAARGRPRWLLVGAAFVLIAATVVVGIGLVGLALDETSGLIEGRHSPTVVGLRRTVPLPESWNRFF